MEQTAEGGAYTPGYILEIRKEIGDKKITYDEAVRKILCQNNMEEIIPVNVWELARRLGFNVLEGNFQDKHTSGMMIDSQEIINPFRSKRVIIINRLDSDEIQAFTIAHELGHFILHKKGQETFFEAFHFAYTLAGKNELSSDVWLRKAREDEADYFAACLLMPRDKFINSVITSRNRNSNMWLIKELAITYMVPEEAVEKRIKEIESKRKRPRGLS